MRLLLLALVALYCSSCATAKDGPGVYIIKLEHGWPPNVAKQLNEEIGNDYPNLMVLGDWRSNSVTLWPLDDVNIKPEVIAKLEARVRELDRSR